MINTTFCEECNLVVDVLVNEAVSQLPPEIRRPYDRDRRRHSRIHKKKLVAFNALGYRPGNTREVRARTDSALPSLAPDQPFEVQVAAGHSLVQAWFERSYDSAAELGYWQSHPRLLQFGSQLDFELLFPHELAQELVNHYGKDPHERINPNSLTWTP